MEKELEKNLQNFTGEFIFCHIGYCVHLLMYKKVQNDVNDTSKSTFTVRNNIYYYHEIKKIRAPIKKRHVIIMNRFLYRLMLLLFRRGRPAVFSYDMKTKGCRRDPLLHLLPEYRVICGQLFPAKKIQETCGRNKKKHQQKHQD